MRLVLTSLCFAAVLAGSIWGDDIDFPFGPFRMYASSEAVDGPVSHYVLRGRTAGTPETDLAAGDFGVRPAELEGRLGELTADCGLLTQLMSAYDRRHPAGPPLAELSLVRRTQPLDGGQPSGPARDETVARSCR
ncbi:MAG TPA: hypothetical protein VKD67_03325 [Acidimicrobiales bacterium]|nr:hypothetical protein [Acidimicrobiales bacterium]